MLADSSMEKAEDQFFPPSSMSAREFYQAGYLQELNRQFLHPLGLAIGVSLSKEHGEESKCRFLPYVIDVRSDLEGITFDESVTSEEVFQKKAAYIRAQQVARCAVRLKTLGFNIQPVPKVLSTPLSDKEEVSEPPTCIEPLTRKHLAELKESLQSQPLSVVETTQIIGSLESMIESCDLLSVYCAKLENDVLAGMISGFFTTTIAQTD